MRFFPLFLLCLTFVVSVTSVSSLPGLHRTENVPSTEASSIATAWSALSSSFHEAETNTDWSASDKFADLRQAHVKQHGCAFGTLKVNDDLEEHLRVGLFAHPGKSYDVFTRISSGSGNGFSRNPLTLDRTNYHHKWDVLPDNRAIAMKIFGTHETETKTTDFTFTTSKCPFVKDAAQAAIYFPEVDSHHPISGYDKMLVKHLDIASLLASTGKSGYVHSLMESEYFASAPHAWGEERAVRMKLTPCSTNKLNLGGILSQWWHYLSNTNVLHEILYGKSFGGDREDNCFYVEVQLFKDEMTTPVEDATREWNSQWQRVAKLSYNKETIGTYSEDPINGNEAVCRQLTFNPANTPSEHRGIGGVQRTRNFIYTHIQEDRIAAQKQMGYSCPQMKGAKKHECDINWLKEKFGLSHGAVGMEAIEMDKEGEMEEEHKEEHHEGHHGHHGGVHVNVEVQL